MEKISIVCLIYQSIDYANFVYKNILKYTPELLTGEAEFYFISNDASEEVLTYLIENNLPYYINNNPVYTRDELFNMGFAFPEYINKVYRGYNYGIRMSNNPIVVLINSDNAFSPGWLRCMRNKLTDNTIVSSILIQPHQFFNPRNGSPCVVFNCGDSLSTFNEDRFIHRASEIKNDSISIGNAFMPLMLYKWQAELVGYYPEGNLHNGDYNSIKATGDHEFINRLEAKGISHITANDSIAYHFQEGEKYKKL
jgi:hypothetical protein